jgi:hypothetical protein
MTKPTLAYLGNALDAAGWRLAGAVVDSPLPGSEVAAFAAARASAAVVLVSSEVARALPMDVLEPALAALQPLVLVLPDDSGTRPLAFDPAERVRRQLGLEPEPATAGAPEAGATTDTVR